MRADSASFPHRSLSLHSVPLRSVSLYSTLPSFPSLLCPILCPLFFHLASPPSSPLTASSLPPPVPTEAPPEVAEADEVDPEVEPREAEDLPTPEEPVEVELEVALPEVEPPLLRRRPPPLTSTTPTLSLRSLKRRVDRLLVVFSLLPLFFPTLSFPFARHDSRLSPLLFLFDAILQLPSFLFLFLFPSSSCTFVFPLPFRNAAVAALSSVRPFVFSTPFSVPGDVKTRALHEGKSDPMQRANGAHRLVQASPDMLLSRKRNK
jgi:hypothetical protein